jgi:hypothetical protein
MNFCATHLIPERRERWCYFVPAVYRLRRVWRAQTRKQVKLAQVTF